MTRPRLYKLVDWLIARRAERAGLEKPRRGMLMVNSGGLGDSILFSLIASRFTDLVEAGEPVDLVVRDGSAAAAFLYPPEINVISLDYRRYRRDPLYRYRKSAELQDRRYRIAVSTDHLRLPTVDDALVRATAAERTAGLKPRSWPKHDAELQRNLDFYTDIIEPSAGMAHRMIRWLELINALTGGSHPPPLVRFALERLPVPDEAASSCVLLHPFSSEAPRQFPYRRFEAIVERLGDRFSIILSAGPGDLERNPEYRGLLRRSNVGLNEDPLQAKLAVLRSARLVVSVDTSIMHLAVGAGAPTLCLSSAAHVVDSVPYDPAITPDNVTFLYHDMPCRGCLGNCIHPLEEGRFACVARLSGDEVVAAVEAALAPSAGE